MTASSKESPLEFEVIPEVGLSNAHIEFTLGMPINQVISMLLKTRKIQNIKFYYSRKEPFSKEICLILDSNGINLYFDPLSQFLRSIVVNDFSKIVLTYKQKPFSQPNAEVTLDKLDQCFGSTVPGVYDQQRKMYMQFWPGLSFVFPNNVGMHVAPGFGSQLSSLQYAAQPKLVSMSIFKGSSPNEMENVEMPLSSYCGQNKLDSIECDLNKLEDGFLIKYTTQEIHSLGQSGCSLVPLSKTINFGDTVATVLSSLGAPSKVFYKSEDKMSIHRLEGNKETCKGHLPHFYFNYFSMGMVVLFNIRTKRVMKVVLHTNLPGHYDFGIYSRSFFKITAGDDVKEVTNQSKFSDISSLFNDDTCSKPIAPVVLRTRDELDPFTPTYLYGTSNMIIEVMDNEYIASVTFYDPNCTE